MILNLAIFNNIPAFIITVVIFLVVYGGLAFLFYFVVKRLWSYIILFVSFVLVFVTYLFNLFEAFVFASVVSSVLILLILFINLTPIKTFLSSPIKHTFGRSNKKTVQKIFDRQEFYRIINDTVLQFSKSKTGALITFEKNDDVASSTNNGVYVNAPVSQELLSTIFYPGTRLHDGAVVIKGNMIKYAAVFYTPSTQAYTGKYGSRHRAAIGISEISDAITVVVSEETGRISIAVGGQIESVSSEDFLTVFENYMLTDEDKKLEIYE